jgi:hypothetical protein
MAHSPSLLHLGIRDFPCLRLFVSSGSTRLGGRYLHTTPLLKRMVAPFPTTTLHTACNPPLTCTLRGQVSLLGQTDVVVQGRPRLSRDSSSPPRGLTKSSRIAPRFVWNRRQRGPPVSLRGRILVLLDRQPSWTHSDGNHLQDSQPRPPMCSTLTILATRTLSQSGSRVADPLSCPFLTL